MKRHTNKYVTNSTAFVVRSGAIYESIAAAYSAPRGRHPRLLVDSTRKYGVHFATNFVVTAQKRSENIQDVPIAITAFAAKTLQDKAIVDLHSLSNLVPSGKLERHRKNNSVSAVS